MRSTLKRAQKVFSAKRNFQNDVTNAAASAKNSQNRHRLPTLLHDCLHTIISCVRNSVSVIVRDAAATRSAIDEGLPANPYFRSCVDHEPPNIFFAVGGNRLHFGSLCGIIECASVPE